MPLSTCRDCGREVSTRAHHCVHCGRPWPSRTCCSPLVAGALIGLVALTAVGGAILVRNRCHKLRECKIERIEREADRTRTESVSAPVPKAAEDRK